MGAVPNAAWLGVRLLGLVSVILMALVDPLPVHAELHFPQPLAQAGEVRSGAPLAQRFAFFNRGPDVVTITELKASCGCLTPRLGPGTVALPHAYRPNDEGEVLLEVNTLSQAAGPQSWRVTVCYEMGGQRYEAPLQIVGRIVSEVSVLPAAVTVFTDGAISQELTVTDLRARPLSVVDIRTSSPQLQGRVTEHGNDAAGHRLCKIRLDVGDDYPVGRQEETVDLVTDDAAYRTLKVPVTIVKRGRERVTVSPDEVTMHGDKGQPVASQLLRVRDSANEGIVVERVTADDPALTCSWAAGPNTMATVKIRLDRTRVAGTTLKSAIHIEVSKPERRTLTVPVTCTLE
jgi:hypothetical protein